MRAPRSLALIVLSVVALGGCGRSEPVSGYFEAEPYRAFRETGGVTVEPNRLRFERGFELRTQDIGLLGRGDRATSLGQSFADLSGDLPISGTIELRRIVSASAVNAVRSCAREMPPTHAALVRLPEGMVMYLFSGQAAPGSDASDTQLCGVYEYRAVQPHDPNRYSRGG